MLLLSLIGCTATSAIEQPKADVPKFSQDEVTTMVKSQLLERRIGEYMVIQSVIYTEGYVGDGKWSGTGEVTMEVAQKGTVSDGGRGSYFRRNYGQPTVHTKRITWNFYEKSQTLEILP